MDLQASLNRLAGTDGLDAAGAANVGAGTSGLDLQGAVNAWAGTDGLDLNGACKALAEIYGGNPALDAQGALDSASATDPLVLEAIWRVSALQNGSGAEMVDLAGGVADVAPEPNPKIVEPSSFTGERLIGQMALTGGTNTGDWFTDLDVRFTAAVLPHHERDTGSIWAEILNIPVSGSSNVRDFLEPAFLFEADGAVHIGLDWDSVGEGDPGSWVSGETVGDWGDGVPERDYRLTVVAATGAVSLYVDDELVEEDTIGATSFPEPPDANECNAGPIQNLITVKSVEVLDGIDGAPIISFDSEVTTGWQAAVGGVVEPPAGPVFCGAAAIEGHSFDAATFDIGAGDSMTWVMKMQPFPSTVASWWRRGDLQSILFGGAAGWIMVDAAPYGQGNRFHISDGTNTVVKTLGTVTFVEQVLTVVLDRDTDELRAYKDGVEIGSGADASALGAVAPDAGHVPFGTWVFGDEALIFDRVLTDEEITHLSEVL